MTYPAFPEAGLDPNVLAWSTHVSPKFVTNEVKKASGRSVRRQQYAAAIYDLELTYEVLQSAAATDALQTIMGFFASQQGQATPFWIPLPGITGVVGQSLGTGDGSTKTFPFVRNFGSYSEPVPGLSYVNVYLNGTVIAPGAATINSAYPPTITFTTAPGSGVAITADFNELRLARFSDDVEDFQENYSMLWELNTLKLQTVRPSVGDAPPGPNPTPSSGPGDIVPNNLIFFYSLRAINTEYASGGQLAIRVRRGSDDDAIDLTILISGGLDIPTATLFGAGTSLYVVTWYDQSGNGHHLTQANPSQQPLLLFNQANGLPGVQFVSANSNYLGYFDPTLSQATPMSFTAVAQGSSSQMSIYGNTQLGSGVQLQLTNAVAGVYSEGVLLNSALTLSASSGEAHAWQSVLNGDVSSAILNVDGTETTGNAGDGVLLAGANSCIGLYQSTYLDAIVYEIGCWSLAFSNGQRSDLHLSDSLYYGTP